MKENKTKETKVSVEKFIDSIKDETVRNDCYTIEKLMASVTKEKPRMWGTSIIGFGSYHYKYESGREGDMCMAGFSPRKQNITIYLMVGLSIQQENLKKLGKYKTSKSCLHIKTLSDIDLKVLKKMLELSYKEMKKKYPASK